NARCILPQLHLLSRRGEGGAGMFWRKWIVRVLVFSTIGACAAVALLYEHFTNPSAVRTLVLAKLKEHFPGATATIDSARLLILEDRGEDGAARTLELTDVDLTLINDPIATVLIEGSAHSDAAGTLRLRGHWQRETKEIILTLTAHEINLAGIVVERLEKLCP